MNFIPNNPYISTGNTVSGFTQCNPNDFGKLCADYGLPYNFRALAACQRYFATVERRDPEIDELSFSVKYFDSKCNTPSTTAVSDFKTDSALSGVIFKDITDKLSALGKDTNYTLTDIFRVCDAYLRRAKKNPPSPSVFAVCGDNTRLEFAARGCRISAQLGIENSDSVCVCGYPDAAPHSREAADENDSITLLFATDGYCGNFAADAYEIVNDSVIGKNVKRAAAVGEDGIFGFIVENCRGAFADITRLPGFLDVGTPDYLTKPLRESMIILIKYESVLQLSELAAAHRLNLISFARPVRGTRLSVRYSMGAPLSLDLSFIKNTRFISSCVFDSVTGLFVETESPHPKMTAGTDKTVLDYPIASASRQLLSAGATSSATLRDTVNTVVSAIAVQVAAGVKYENIVTSFDMSLSVPDREPLTLGRALEPLLGLHLVKAELALLSSNRRLRFGDKNSLAVFCASPVPETTIPAKPSGEASKLYLLSPHCKDGIPDFDELRRLFRYINSLAENGKLRSTRAVGCDGAAKTLEAMTAEFDFEPSVNCSSALYEAGAGAFIIESGEVICGFPLGIIRQKD